MHRDFFRIYEDIQKKIQEEFFLSGQKISETELMKMYSCSRGLIRTIISWCDINNVLEVIPKSGTYVANETQESFREKVEVRTYLEKLACRLLIARIEARELAVLENLVEKMTRELDIIPYSPQEFSDIHYQFHFKIIEYSRNQILITSFRNLNLRYSYLFAEGASTDVRILLRSNKEHRNLVEAIKKRDRLLVEDIIDKHLWVHKKIPLSLKTLGIKVKSHVIVKERRNNEHR